jgi:ABC-type phosphate transport system ATPase subunit
MKAFRGQPSVYASTQPADRQAELEVKKIFLNFGGVMALHDVDLTVHTGELVSVIGPNGVLQVITIHKRERFCSMEKMLRAVTPMRSQKKGLEGPIRILNSSQV